MRWISFFWGSSKYECKGSHAKWRPNLLCSDLLCSYFDEPQKNEICFLMCQNSDVTFYLLQCRHIWTKFYSLWHNLMGHIFIPHHTKGSGVLCYSIQTLSIRPPVNASFPCSNFSTFDLFSSILHRHWYRGGVVWDCKWANFILKQQSYGPWCMSKMLCTSFPCSNFSTFLPIFFKFCIDIGIREEWYGIASGIISFGNNRVMALDLCPKCIFGQYLKNE